MSDVAAFLLARLDEWASTAREAGAAQGLDWLDHGGVVVSRTAPADAPGRFLDMYAPSGTWALWDCEGASSLGVHPASALHIARHDPARTLRQVAATRRVVEEHPETRSTRRRHRDRGPYCSTCQESESVGAALWPCPTLRALAAIFADHPDYREDWAL